MVREILPVSPRPAAKGSSRPGTTLISMDGPAPENRDAEEPGHQNHCGAVHMVASVEIPRTSMWHRGRWTRCTSCNSASWVALILPPPTRRWHGRGTTAFGKQVVPETTGSMRGRGAFSGTARPCSAGRVRRSKGNSFRPGTDPGPGVAPASVDVTVTQRASGRKSATRRAKNPSVASHRSQLPASGRRNNAFRRASISCSCRPPPRRLRAREPCQRNVPGIVPEMEHAPCPRAWFHRFRSPAATLRTRSWNSL